MSRRVKKSTRKRPVKRSQPARPIANGKINNSEPDELPAEEFEREGWNLVSITESIDTKTPMGRAFFALIGIFAQLERDLTRERTRLSMQRKKELGVVLGRKSQITKAQFRDIERRLLKPKVDGKRRESIADIARSIKVNGKSISAPTVNHHFPGWRSKTKAERVAWRKANPLPNT